MYQRMMTGPKPESGRRHARPDGPRGVGGGSVILVAIIGLGVFPNLVLDVVNPAVKQHHDPGGGHRPGTQGRPRS